MAKKITSAATAKIKKRISSTPYIGEEVLKQANKASAKPVKTVNSPKVQQKVSKNTIKPKLKKK